MKVLVLGSGALKIGEAGEFDYSGSQALKALKEEGIDTVLINPNIATVQTDKDLANKVYFLPVNAEFVEKVIRREKPDGIMLGFGGQTALNCGVELENTLKKYNVSVLGTPIKSIKDTEDRELFVKKLKEINLKTPRSFTATNISSGLKAAEKIGYPVMLRVSYDLGGRSSGMARNCEELKIMLEKAFSFSKKLLIEEYLAGWKEIEYEVVRDSKDNCITVCNMENLDPMGLHTGESVVIAPCQTLTDFEYQKLREIAIKVVRYLGIIGECNIQFALSHEKWDYRIIEVNARLSRSSALASKATGYPLAYVAAKLSLGRNLVELKNPITKTTTTCFEPSMDYVVVKIPKWDLQKFRGVEHNLGSEMKSVGEVMGIGRSFEESLQKAIRMLENNLGTFMEEASIEEVEKELLTEKRFFAIVKAFEFGYSVEKINKLTKIEQWFLKKIKDIADFKATIKSKRLTYEVLLKAKQLGFSDKQIAKLKNKNELDIFLKYLL
jgi:carbamoyl-phosphate synthase large subunit